YVQRSEATAQTSGRGVDRSVSLADRVAPGKAPHERTGTYSQRVCKRDASGRAPFAQTLNEDARRRPSSAAPGLHRDVEALAVASEAGQFRVPIQPVLAQRITVNPVLVLRVRREEILHRLSCAVR